MDPGEFPRPNVRGSRIQQVRPTPVRQAARLAKHTPRETYGARDTATVQTSVGGSNSLCPVAETHSRLLVSETEKTHRRFRILSEAPAADDSLGHSTRQGLQWLVVILLGCPAATKAIPVRCTRSVLRRWRPHVTTGIRFRSGAPTAVNPAIDRPSSDRRVVGLDWNADREWRREHSSIRYLPGADVARLGLRQACRPADCPTPGDFPIVGRDIIHTVIHR
ncbi:hypothetical protein J2809_001725 [Arthrobacter pascens]|nr:hypothetical protein [Arthrobacter pascens]